MHGSPFFEGVAQTDFESSAGRGKLPVFYYDTSLMIALFPARYRGLCRLMPDPRFRPALLAPGVGVVAIGCLEHRDTDIGPYGELAVSVPLSHPSFRLNVPGRVLLQDDRHGQVHAFMLHLPVTTELAMRGGIDFYNFPKFLARIDFTGAAGRRMCRLAEGEEEVLRLSGRQIAATDHAEKQFFFHLWMDGQPQQAEFKTNQIWRGRSLRPGDATIELGVRHPIAVELGRVLLSRRSLQYDYIPKLEAILYGPEHLTLPLMKRLLDASTVNATHKAVA